MDFAVRCDVIKSLLRIGITINIIIFFFDSQRFWFFFPSVSVDDFSTERPAPIFNCSAYIPFLVEGVWFSLEVFIMIVKNCGRNVKKFTASLFSIFFSALFRLKIIIKTWNVHRILTYKPFLRKDEFTIYILAIYLTDWRHFRFFFHFSNLFSPNRTARQFDTRFTVSCTWRRKRQSVF